MSLLKACLSEEGKQNHGWLFAKDAEESDSTSKSRTLSGVRLEGMQRQEMLGTLPWTQGQAEGRITIRSFAKSFFTLSVRKNL